MFKNTLQFYLTAFEVFDKTQIEIDKLELFAIYIVLLFSLFKYITANFIHSYYTIFSSSQLRQNNTSMCI